MKIGEPVPIDSVAAKRSSYNEIIAAMKLVPDGHALPVEFETIQRARNAQAVTYMTHSLVYKAGIGASRLGNTVYFYRKQEPAQ